MIAVASSQGSSGAGMRRWRVTRFLAPIFAMLLLAACNGANSGRMQGWVEADLIFVGPDEAGRVETLSVREGDQVAAGAPLFSVDAELQQTDVSNAVAQVAEAKARLARQEAAQQRKEEIAVLRAQENRAEAMLQLSTAELDRQQTLASKGVAAQAALDTAKANFNRDKAALEEIRRQITVASLSSREEDIMAARESLAAAKARQTAAETKLARRKLVSPVAGTVQQVYYRPGEMVPAGRPVVSILPPGNIKVRFFVSETVLPKVNYGDPVEVTCDGCAAPIAAKVSFISRSSEYTPPVIYSLEERNKLVFMIEARTDQPQSLRVGQPVSVAFAEAKR
jgi:HlyD family secretion protein